MFSQQSYQGQGIAQAPGRSRAGEILGQGIANLGAGIGAGVGAWKQRKAEGKVTRALAMTIIKGQKDIALSQPDADPATINAAFDKHMGSLEDQSTAQIRGFVEAQSTLTALRTLATSQARQREDGARADLTEARLNKGQQTTIDALSVIQL